VNAGCAPQWIGETHLPDEITDVLRYGGVSGPTRVPPPWPQLGQADPKDTVGRSETRASRPSVLQDGELLAKGEDLELKRRSAPDGRDHYR
jgi:hypothetical protein